MSHDSTLHTEPLGYLDEAAIRTLASAIIAGEPDGERLRIALRTFMVRCQAAHISQSGPAQ